MRKLDVASYIGVATILPDYGILLKAHIVCRVDFGSDWFVGASKL